MIFATVTGRITKDAELRQAGSQKVCAISIASNKKDRNGESVATFIDASLWGKRGEAIVGFLRKGTNVTAVGELSKREHEGKTYLSLNVSEIDFSGGAPRDGKQQQKPPSEPSGGGDGGYSDQEYGGGRSDDIPFAANVTNEPAERWWKRP
jgi:single-strand DNA-binding protein